MSDTVSPEMQQKHRLMQQAFDEARARVYKIHQALGVPVAVMRDGEIIVKLPEELDPPTPEESLIRE